MPRSDAISGLGCRGCFIARSRRGRCPAALAVAGAAEYGGCLAAACLHLLEHYDGPAQVNLDSGSDVTIAEIAETIARVVGFTGKTEWDSTKPDGTPQKLLDVSKLANVGWTAQIGLEDGLRSTVQWYHDHMDTLRQ